MTTAVARIATPGFGEISFIHDPLCLLTALQEPQPVLFHRNFLRFRDRHLACCWVQRTLSANRCVAFDFPNSPPLVQEELLCTLGFPFPEVP